MDALFLRALFPEHLKHPNDMLSCDDATLLANDAARQAWRSSITGGVPNIPHEDQIYGGHHQCDI